MFTEMVTEIRPECNRHFVIVFNHCYTLASLSWGKIPDLQSHVFFTLFPPNSPQTPHPNIPFSCCRWLGRKGWPVVVLQAPLGQGGAAGSACGLNGPPKGLTVDLLGFFLTEDTDWGANPTCSRVPSTFRPSTDSPVVTKLFLVVT